MTRTKKGLIKAIKEGRAVKKPKAKMKAKGARMLRSAHVEGNSQTSEEQSAPSATVIESTLPPTPIKQEPETQIENSADALMQVDYCHSSTLFPARDLRSIPSQVECAKNVPSSTRRVTRSSANKNTPKDDPKTYPTVVEGNSGSWKIKIESSSSELNDDSQETAPETVQRVVEDQLSLKTQLAKKNGTLMDDCEILIKKEPPISVGENAGGSNIGEMSPQNDAKLETSLSTAAEVHETRNPSDECLVIEKPVVRIEVIDLTIDPEPFCGSTEIERDNNITFPSRIKLEKQDNQTLGCNEMDSHCVKSVLLEKADNSSNTVRIKVEQDVQTVISNEANNGGVDHLDFQIANDSSIDCSLNAVCIKTEKCVQDYQSEVSTECSVSMLACQKQVNDSSTENSFNAATAKIDRVVEDNQRKASCENRNEHVIEGPKETSSSLTNHSLNAIRIKTEKDINQSSINHDSKCQPKNNDSSLDQPLNAIKNIQNASLINLGENINESVNVKSCQNESQNSDYQKKYMNSSNDYPSNAIAVKIEQVDEADGISNDLVMNNSVYLKEAMNSTRAEQPQIECNESHKPKEALSEKTVNSNSPSQLLAKQNSGDNSPSPNRTKTFPTPLLKYFNCNIVFGVNEVAEVLAHLKNLKLIHQKMKNDAIGLTDVLDPSEISLVHEKQESPNKPNLESPLSVLENGTQLKTSGLFSREVIDEVSNISTNLPTMPSDLNVEKTNEDLHQAAGKVNVDRTQLKTSGLFSRDLIDEISNILTNLHTMPSYLNAEKTNEDLHQAAGKVNVDRTQLKTSGLFSRDINDEISNILTNLPTMPSYLNAEKTNEDLHQAAGKVNVDRTQLKKSGLFSRDVIDEVSNMVGKVVLTPSDLNAEKTNEDLHQAAGKVNVHVPKDFSFDDLKKTFKSPMKMGGSSHTSGSRTIYCDSPMDIDATSEEEDNSFRPPSPNVISAPQLNTEKVANVSKDELLEIIKNTKTIEHSSDGHPIPCRVTNRQKIDNFSNEELLPIMANVGNSTNNISTVASKNVSKMSDPSSGSGGKKLGLEEYRLKRNINTRDPRLKVPPVLPNGEQSSAGPSLPSGAVSPLSSFNSPSNQSFSTMFQPLSTPGSSLRHSTPHLPLPQYPFNVSARGDSVGHQLQPPIRQLHQTFVKQTHLPFRERHPYMPTENENARFKAPPMPPTSPFKFRLAHHSSYITRIQTDVSSASCFSPPLPPESPPPPPPLPPSDKEFQSIINKKPMFLNLISPSLRADIGKNMIDTNDMYLIIIEWSIDWMLDSVAPPFLSVCRHIQNTYNDPLEYYNTYFPLLLLKCWHKISVALRDKPSKGDLCCKIVNFESKQNYINVMCDSVIRVSDLELLPKDGYVVQVKFGTLPRGSLKMLGYICSAFQRTYSPKYDHRHETLKMISPADRVNLLKIKLSFFVVFSSQDINLELPIQLTKLVNIKKYLIQNDALKKLCASPLCDTVVNPLRNQVRTFKLPPRHDSEGMNTLVQAMVQSVDELTPQITVIIKSTLFTDTFVAVVKIMNEVLKLKSPAKMLVCVRPDTLSKMAINLVQTSCDMVILNREREILDKSLHGYILENKMRKYPQEIAKETVLQKCNVILAVTSSCFYEDVKCMAPNLKYCILYEASTFSEPECVVPLLYKIQHLFLIGDPLVPNNVSQRTVGLFHRAYNVS
ncbi:uncharacterized protein CEXT_133411 [Caerostris extrusa]|uniref:DNA2/NAM7 helicase helicase domain-containing protein n=1 Tax=Caerostris extrusa TaxID=172846 RepID=A0AAV4PWF3_CAEEX|nr:uncharacterized protein CEXT_133411 [Caerostris extrusa]